MNTLYYGDNLKILRDYIKDESVDLVYLDPPLRLKDSFGMVPTGGNATVKERAVAPSSAESEGTLVDTRVSALNATYKRRHRCFPNPRTANQTDANRSRRKRAFTILILFRTITTP